MRGNQTMKMLEKMIGGITEIQTNDRTRYECQLLLTGEELEQFPYTIGDPARWAARDAIICGFHKTFLADGSWILRITAENCRYEKNLPVIRLNSDTLLKHVEESYDIGAIFFPLEWFGCRTATASDCTPFSDQTAEHIPGGTVKYQSPDGSWAVPGGIIALNSTPLTCAPDGTTIQHADPGSMEFNSSPFADALPADFIKQTITTRLYRCRFYTQKEMRRINGFCGINGKFGNRVHVYPAERGKWLAKSQSLKLVTDARGNIFTRVERVMLEAPGALHWADKRNGGVWTW